MADPLTRLRAFQRELEGGNLLTAAFDLAYPNAVEEYREARKTCAADLGALLDEREALDAAYEKAIASLDAHEHSTGDQHG